MKIYLPIAKVDKDSREVWGYASTEARDDQGEIVKREALTAALGDYMKFANIREMHQLSAVGVAREAAVDEKGLYIGAKIVDDHAWQKVIEGVYKGYSIGGRVTQRDANDYKTITGLVLNEISLVDRPANPEAVFDYWKAGVSRASETRFSPPVQIWTCGVPEHRHLAKAESLKCQEHMTGSPIGFATKPAVDSREGSVRGNAASEAGYGDVSYADPGYQPDGKKRYPIDSEGHIRAAWNFIHRPRNAKKYTPAQLDKIKARIIAAWKEKIDEHGPASADQAAVQRELTRSAFVKALWDVGHVARIILDLNQLKDNLETEEQMAEDDSPELARLPVLIDEVCSVLSILVAEETRQTLDGTEGSEELSTSVASDVLTMAAGAAGTALIADLCRNQGSTLHKFAVAIYAKAKLSADDQALLDLAYQAVGKCMGMRGLLFAERTHMVRARDALKAAGAVASEKPIGGRTLNPKIDPRLLAQTAEEHCLSENSELALACHGPMTGDARLLEVITAALDKRGQAHQALMDVAHDCIGELTDGGCCLTLRVGARHSKEKIGHLAAAHDHLVAAGAKCGGPVIDAAPEPAEVGATKLAKQLADERGEKSALIATLNDLVPRIDHLAKRVDDIARTPLPPLAITKNITAISKQQDAALTAFSADEIAAAFSRMSKEEQTLTLIKASYARPIHPPGLRPSTDANTE